MGWPGTLPWSGLTAAELRPVIVALINAVNDRREAIGLDRRAWAVNLDQSNTSLTLGTKSTALEESDLYSLDLFRYSYWTTMASDIRTMVELGDSITANPDTECCGFSKAGTDGTGTDRWTVAELETDAGLGAMASSDVSGGTIPHLFDEKAPNRLRLILDNLIYPVIYPYDYWQFPTFTSWVDAIVDTEQAAASTDDDTTPDAAWAGLTSPSTPLEAFGGSVGYINPPVARATENPLTHVICDFDLRTQNGNGYLGVVETRKLVVERDANSLEGMDYTVDGNSDSISGTVSDVTTYTDSASMTLSGQQNLEYTVDAWDGSGSPFTNEAVGGSGIFGYGRVDIKPLVRFAASGNDRDGASEIDQTTRIILDISGVVSDQI